MKNPIEIKKVAWQRLEEAIILYKNAKCDSSFYLAGYCVELMLKAKICERLGIPNLFDETDAKANQTSDTAEIRNILKTHNLFTLLIFSGLKVKFDLDKAKNSNLAKTNSLLFNNWNENGVYRSNGSIKGKDVEILLNFLTADDGILKWIEQN